MVAKSSTKVEYRALASATTEIVWLKALLCEIRVSYPTFPILRYDNLSAVALASNPILHA